MEPGDQRVPVIELECIVELALNCSLHCAQLHCAAGTQLQLWNHLLIEPRSCALLDLQSAIKASVQCVQFPQCSVCSVHWSAVCSVSSVQKLHTYIGQSPRGIPVIQFTHCAPFVIWRSIDDDAYLSEILVCLLLNQMQTIALSSPIDCFSSAQITEEHSMLQLKEPQTNIKRIYIH